MQQAYASQGDKIGGLLWQNGLVLMELLKKSKRFAGLRKKIY